MKISQQVSSRKILEKASIRQRIAALAVFGCVAGFFAVFILEGAGKLDLGWIFTPCGFKQRFHIPCPACGMTTAARAFATGRFAEAFYIQPAGGLFCTLLAITGFLSFITAAGGVYFTFLRRLFAEVKIRYFVLAMIIVVAAGWAVTLARALARGG
jgi:hypothetical protein